MTFHHSVVWGCAWGAACSWEPSKNQRASRGLNEGASEAAWLGLGIRCVYAKGQSIKEG
jgi:hypothetical protein